MKTIKEKLKPKNLCVTPLEYTGTCPSCEAMVCFDHKYCHNCAQALDWTDVEKYREKIFQQLKDTKETYETMIKGVYYDNP